MNDWQVFFFFLNNYKCDAIEQNDSEVMQITCLVFHIAVLGIFNVSFCWNLHENWLIGSRDRYKYLKVL